MPRRPEDLIERARRSRAFEWDDGNAGKIWARHRTSRQECERVFFDVRVLVADDVKHSQSEPRFLALGRTLKGRRLLVVFTVPGELIRVISARDMSRRERRRFARAQETS